MKDAIATVGTSPEVLQHYLTAGIDIQSCYNDGTEEFSAKLLGLEMRDDAWRAKVQYDDRQVGFVCLPNWLPILLPFSALTAALADGTVPLLHLLGIKQELVAKIALSHHYGSACYEVRLWYILDPIRFPDLARPGNLKLWQVDYLRSKHFAVGLEPHQYIPKAGAPNIQEGKSA